MKASFFASPARRSVLTGLTALLGGAVAPRLAAAQPHVFDAEAVRRRARALAAAPYAPPANGRPQLAGLSYDQYRAIRFNKARQLWAEQALAFRAEFFPPAFLYPRPVALFEVADGQARPIGYAPDYFTFPADHAAQGENLGGFSGARFLWPINDPQRLDEIGVFQGASYFRSLGRDQFYGLSARGLAIGTGEPREEFPDFTTFWIERPALGDEALTVHALMDSKSVTGAYRFVIRPGRNTVFDVEATLYPRADIAKGGVAPMSSMYLFGYGDRPDADDFRTGVHDSDGLAIWTGQGERIWRALANHRTLQLSAFPDDSPRGFGLMQRERDLESFGDLEARYDKRPSLWVEPLDDWGPGAVHLVEIATRLETDDNIAAFWRPAQPWRAGEAAILRYRLHWGTEPYPTPLAQVRRTRAGGHYQLGHDRPADGRLFTIDFAGGELADGLGGIAIEARCEGGETVMTALGAYPAPAAARAAFAFRPQAATVELSLRLMRDGKPISETWRRRWTA